MLPQCLDPSQPCSHASDVETPNTVTVTAMIQVGANTAGQPLYVPVDTAHRQCAPTSASASAAIASACAAADVSHVSSGALVDESVSSNNCLTSSQYCTFTATSYRFEANSVTSDEYVTLIAEDGDGNTRPCEFTVTVLDETVPIMTCPADVTDGVTDASQPYGSVAGGLVLPLLTPVGDIATDNVAVQSLIAQLETAPESCLPTDGSTSGAAYDLCVAANIAVADGTGQGGPSNANCVTVSGCTYTAPTRETVSAATQFAIGNNELVYHAEDTGLDEFGGTRRNAAECRITVVVTDNQNPVITQSACVDVQAFTDDGDNFATVRGPFDSNNNVYVPSVAFPTGLVDPCEWADMSGTPAEDMAACANVVTGGAACIYSTDSCQGQGNRYADTADNSGPGLSVVPSVAEQCIVCAGTASEEAAAPTTCSLSGTACTATAGQGSCVYYAGGVDVALDTPFIVGPLGCATTVLFTATDPSGNTDTCSILVVVKDDEPPVIDDTSCVGPTTQSDTDQSFTTTAGHLTLPGVQATDNNVVTVTPSLIEQCIVVPGTIAQEIATPTTCFLNAASCLVTAGSGSCDYIPAGVVTAASEFPIGTVTVLFTAEDGSPDSSADVCTVQVTVDDLQSPVINCPPDFLNAQTNPGVGYYDTATSLAYGLPTPQFPTTTGLAIDNSDPVYGGAGNGVSMIRVERDLGNGGRAEINHLSTGAASDNSVHFPIGSSTVFYTAYDRHSTPNEVECSITVVVTDVEPPTITCPAGDPAVTGAADASHDYATIDGGGVVIPETGFGSVGSMAADNADGVSLGVTQITRELVVHGPPSSSSNTVDTSDSCTSTLAAGPNTVTPSDSVNCNLDSSIDFGVTDGSCVDVDSVVATCTYVIGTYTTRSALTGTTQFPIGLSEVVYTAYDAEGNTQACAINVRVVDLVPPVIDDLSCVNVAATTDPSVGYAIVDPCAWADMSGTDAEDAIECAAASDGSCTYSTDSCVGSAYVGDLVFPEIIATDNSGPEKIHIVPALVDGTPVTAATQFAIGNTVVVFTVSDEASTPNTDSCQITVTVTDDQLPVINCPADITNAVTDTGQNYASPAGFGITTPQQRLQLVGNNHQGSLAQDNSDGHYGGNGAGVQTILVYLVHNPGAGETLEAVDSLTQYPIGVNEVRYTATDQASNSESCSITLTVSDNQPPVIDDLTCTDPLASSDASLSFSTTDVSGTVVLPTVQASDNHVVAVSPTLVEQCVIVPGTAAEEATVSTVCDLAGGACTVLSGAGNCIYEAGGIAESCTAPVVDCVTGYIQGTPGTCPTGAGCTLAGVGGSETCSPTVSDCLTGYTPGDVSTCPAGCDFVNADYDVTSATEFLIGQTTVVLTAADQATPANTDDCSVVVTVADQQPPVITCPADVNGLTEAGVPYATRTHGVTLSPTAGLATDNSDPVYGGTPGDGVYLVRPPKPALPHLLF